jgi:hypothetical protein
MMGGVYPETRGAIKKHWNNKFYYTVASCWFFLRDIYYDARLHECQILSSYSSISFALVLLTIDIEAFDNAVIDLTMNMFFICL